MTWKDLRACRHAPPEELADKLLRYAHKLWRYDTTARALLALDRVLFLQPDDPVQYWPLPYDALQWMLRNHDTSSFIGNPRRHFQHLAGRVSGPHATRRQWTAWAAWYITRQEMPNLEPDRHQHISEPTHADILRGLQLHGLPLEAETWQAVIADGSVIEPQHWPHLPHSNPRANR